MLLTYLGGLIQRGLVSEHQPEDRLGAGLKPVIAFREGGVVRFEQTASFRHGESETDDRDSTGVKS
jgi:hypothetical protein